MQNGRNVGVEGEHRSGAQHRGQQGGKHLRAHQHRQLLAHLRLFARAARREGEEERDHRDHAQKRRRQEGHPPADSFAHPRCGRYAANIGDGEPHKHGCYGAGLFMLRHHACGDHRPETKEGAVIKAGQNTRQQQGGVIRGERRQHVTDGKDRHQEDQRITTAAMGKQQGHQRRPYHYADSVGAD